MNSDDRAGGRVTTFTYDVGGRLLGGTGEPTPAGRETTVYEVDRSIRLTGRPEGVDVLRFHETEIRSRVVVNDGAVATWVFAIEVDSARPKQPSGAGWTRRGRMRMRIQDGQIQNRG